MRKFEIVVELLEYYEILLQHNSQIAHGVPVGFDENDISV